MSGSVLREQGRQALLAGDFAAAVGLLRDCIAQQPADPESHFLFGAASHRAGDLSGARSAFARVCQLEPQHLQAHLALASICLAQQDIPSALAAANAAVGFAPGEAEAVFALALCLESAGRSEEALAGYARTLELQPAHPGALRNRALLLLACDRPADAADVLSAMAAIAPADAWVQAYLGIALAQCERFDEAQAALDLARHLDPRFVQRLRESIFGPSNQAGTAGLDARVLHVLRQSEKLESCDWSVRAHFRERFAELVEHAAKGCMQERALGFRALVAGLDPALQSAQAKRIAAGLRQQAASLPAPKRRPRPEARDGRLRVGYLSGDFHAHATAYLIARLPELHDRKRFEIFLYASGPDDGSSMRHRLTMAADCFRDVRNLDDAGLAQCIADDGIDILVDLAGYTDHARPLALALRPAPLQVSYLAYLQTSGGDWIDYVLLDHQVLVPVERENWTERVAYFPDTFYLCDDSVALAEARGGRAEAGLPEDAFVYCCLNAPWKISPEALACWQRILQQVPHAVLWLYVKEPRHALRLRANAERAGIDPARIVFATALPHAEHLSRFRLADAFLDTFLCNAHTTCVEALSAALPVVTMPGDSVAGRLAASLLVAHGFPELVASTPDAYVELAVRLASDPVWHDSLRKRLSLRGGSRLFCTERRVREIEQAFMMMWERHAAGMAPVDFDVPALT